MVASAKTKHVVGGPELLRRAELENPGVSEVLRVYLRALKSVQEEAGVAEEVGAEAVYYTSDSTAIC